MMKNLFKVGVIILSLATLSTSFTGCKSKKYATEDPTSTKSGYEQRIEQAKRDLLSIINDRGSMGFDEKEYRLNAIKRQNFQDQEVKDLIARADEIMSVLRAERDKKAAEDAKAQQEDQFHQQILDGFRSVANATGFTEANVRIKEALTLYASGDVPLLIIISMENGVKDYDRPTTIRKYLEYIKDVKRFDKGIESIVLDRNGKITEIELIKK